MIQGEYLWILVLGLIVAAIDAFGIGANDVANSFATAVSSKSLTLRQACVIAVFTEFLGAFLLGRGTAKTISSGIIDINLFSNKPELLMFAMLCALMGSSFWVLFATRMGWPVSTTHSIVGAIVGVGISGFGVLAVDWSWKGLPQIIASWFISPAFAGVMAVVVFLPIKHGVLGHANSFRRGLVAIPIIFFLTAVIDSFYLVEKVIKDRNPLSKGATAAIVLGMASSIALFCQFFFVPWLKRCIQGEEDLKFYHVFAIPFLATRPKKMTTKDMEEGKGEVSGMWARVKGVALRGVNKDVLNMDTDHLRQVHDSAARFDDNTEYMFSFLQVITSCMASFAHGSNDVANAVGPISTIIHIYNTGHISPDGVTPVPSWVLISGGLFIDLGLVTYGYNIMRSLGNKITYHSPSRGFSMELSASIAVLTATFLRWPVSTTHCITGSTAAVGLCNGDVHAVNWRMLAWCMFSWILTLPVAGLVAGLLFAFGTRSPSFTVA
ncbi:hypothetical protein DSO57_1021629 [Entomophthora muscae]|uniref:Uncharacterized protein n=1 Tax=Entomophthora muscae TaxID=34485 RepID=A0ACC2S597_9FUNG|nr:hypothetical protein DSO57_1021629 [Entomophthora muscae]